MSFYVVTYYLPSGLFVVVSWISFLVNPEVSILPTFYAFLHAFTAFLLACPSCRMPVLPVSCLSCLHACMSFPSICLSYLFPFLSCRSACLFFLSAWLSFLSAYLPFLSARFSFSPAFSLVFCMPAYLSHFLPAYLPPFLPVRLLNLFAGLLTIQSLSIPTCLLALKLPSLKSDSLPSTVNYCSPYKCT